MRPQGLARLWVFRWPCPENLNKTSHANTEPPLQAAFSYVASLTRHRRADGVTALYRRVNREEFHQKYYSKYLIEKLSLLKVS